MLLEFKLKAELLYLQRKKTIIGIGIALVLAIAGITYLAYGQFPSQLSAPDIEIKSQTDANIEYYSIADKTPEQIVEKSLDLPLLARDGAMDRSTVSETFDSGMLGKDYSTLQSNKESVVHHNYSINGKPAEIIAAQCYQDYLDGEILSYYMFKNGEVEAVVHKINSSNDILWDGLKQKLGKAFLSENIAKEGGKETITHEGFNYTIIEGVGSELYMVVQNSKK